MTLLKHGPIVWILNSADLDIIPLERGWCFARSEQDIARQDQMSTASTFGITQLILINNLMSVIFYSGDPSKLVTLFN